MTHVNSKINLFARTPSAVQLSEKATAASMNACISDVMSRENIILLALEVSRMQRVRRGLCCKFKAARALEVT